MQRNSKIKKILIIVLILLIALIAFLYFSKKDVLIESPVVSEELIKTEEEKFLEIIEEQKSRTIYTFDQESEETREWDEEDFKSIAKSFAERFGSYSNHSNYENISDLSNFPITKKMRNWINSHVKELKNNSTYSGSYYGITSVSLISPEINNFSPNSGKVEVLVSLQRFEKEEGKEENIFNQNLLVTYLKEANEWFIDSAYWQ